MPRTTTVCDSAPAIGRLPALRCAAMEPAPIDFAAEGLLDGLDGEARAERLALLVQLTAEGMPISELRRSTATGTVIFLPADRVIVGPARQTAAEVSERGGAQTALRVAASPA